MSAEHSMTVAPNETVTIHSPEDHTTGGTAEVTFWRDGTVSLRLLSSVGKLKLSTVDLDGMSLEVIAERDW